MFSKSKNATDVVKNLWQNLRLLHYRFEVTYSVYVMDPTEKAIFYILVLLFVAAIFVIIYYPLRYLAYAIVPSFCPLTKTSLETATGMSVVKDVEHIHGASIGGNFTFSTTVEWL